MRNHPLAEDLDHVLAETSELWEEVRGRTIFITGGTGFFGTWLLETFAWANFQMRLGAELVLLSRNPEAFARRLPHLGEDPALRWVTGDLTELTLESVRSQLGSVPALPYIIHAAADASAAQRSDDAGGLVAKMAKGTQRLLEIAVRSGVKRMLFVSSGAVYGRQPVELAHVAEDFPGMLDAGGDSPYAQAKRAAEMQCRHFAEAHGFAATIARCFAFLGPYQSLEAPFAAPQFLRDGLQGNPIRVEAAHPVFRSYLYAADLAIWLWTILIRGQASVPYNVGSEEAVELRTFAGEVASAFTPARTAQASHLPTGSSFGSRYVPSTERARRELGLRETIGRREAIRRTVRWHLAGGDKGR